MTVVLDPAWTGVYNSLALGASEYLPSFLALGSLPTEELVEVIATTTRPSPDANVVVHGLLLSALCPQTGADTTPADRSTPNDFGAVGWGVLVDATLPAVGVPETDPALDEPVTSDIPTLLLVGQFDPGNTAAGARLVASTLTNGYAYEVPAATSNPLGHSDCARRDPRHVRPRPNTSPTPACLLNGAAPRVHDGELSGRSCPGLVDDATPHTDLVLPDPRLVDEHLRFTTGCGSTDRLVVGDPLSGALSPDGRRAVVAGQMGPPPGDSVSR